jgi:hypothetical protein
VRKLRGLMIGLLLGVMGVAGWNAVLPAQASAASSYYCPENPQTVTNLLDFPTWYKYLNPHFANNECVLDAEFPDAIPKIALAVFEIILRVSGMLAVIFVIYGGFQYLTSTGEPDKAKNARTTIINALVGLMIAMLSTVIVNVIGRNIA